MVEFAEELANRGKTVVIAALDGTYQRKKFNRILELVPLAEYVVKLSAVCMICAGDAAFTKRIKTTDDRLELIGGTDFYMATCRECFYKKGLYSTILIFLTVSKFLTVLRFLTVSRFSLVSTVSRFSIVSSFFESPEILDYRRVLTLFQF